MAPPAPEVPAPETMPPPRRLSEEEVVALRVERTGSRSESQPDKPTPPGLSAVSSVYQLAAAIALGEGDPCTISFDQNLQNIFQDAVANTFANRTTHTGDALGSCPRSAPVTDSKDCWVYRQSCQAGQYIAVYPQNAGHFHLSFEDPTINCVNETGFGRRSGRYAKCVSAAWASERRILQTHDGRTWIEIANKDHATASHNLFDLPSIDVGGSTPIQLWFEELDGSVWGWDQLAPGNLPLDLRGVKALWLRSAADQFQGMTINEFVVRL